MSARRRKKKLHEREDNPGWLAVGGAALAGTLIGTAATFRGIGGNPTGEADHIELDDYEGAVLLFPPTGVLGHGVNYFTGREGYSHAGLDIGLVTPEGEPLWVDSWVMEGVAVREASKFDSEPIRFVLTEFEAVHVRAVALHMLYEKTPYRGGSNGRTCSELVVCCLPPEMVARYRIPKDATPNQLAKAFGLTTTVRALKNRLLR